MGTAKPPTAFVSYSWEDEAHKAWVLNISTRLRTDGVDVTLDRWATAPGDQLTHFMETAVRENRFVLIICTPRYKQKSDARLGGVGYEGDIMTGEVFNTRNRSKFIPILRHGQPADAIPSWLSSSYYIDLSEGAHIETNYQDLIQTIHGVREQAPPIGPAPTFKVSPSPRPNSISGSSAAMAPSPEEPIKIVRILVDQVGTPRNDGTYGSALYAVPFQLSRRPSSDWARIFIENWNHPPEWSTSHRPNIARVEGSTVILDGTTVEEVESCHRKTLVLALNKTNRMIEEYEAKKRWEAERKAEQLRKQEDAVRDAAKRIRFD